MIVKLYAHEDSDDIEDDVESWVGAGVPEDAAQELIGNRPLYEVRFEFEYDPETREIDLVAVKLPDGRFTCQPA
jgi:hypothetical protein